MNPKNAVLIVLSLTGVGVLGCQPVSTFNLPQQEDSIEMQGQSAMASEDGTLGDRATSELEPTHQNGINFDAPDPFIDADTVRQEEGIEGDETD